MAHTTSCLHFIDARRALGWKLVESSVPAAHATGPPPTHPRMSRLLRHPWLILCLLLGAHAALATAAARRTSPTVDEVNHLPAGISYWQQGTFALYHHNPPLVKLLAALPVLASDPKVDYGGSWADAMAKGYPPSQAAFGAEFMRANAERYFELYFRARCVIVAVSLAGGLAVFLWTRELFGVAAALTASTLWCFSPNILAHAGLVTTDLPAAVAILASTYVFWRWLRKPTFACASVAGLMLGVAQLTKFSALSLYVIWPLAGLLYVWLTQRADAPPEKNMNPVEGRSTPSRTGRFKLLLQAALILVLSVPTINAGYGFEGTCRPLGSFPFVSSALTRSRTTGQSPYPNHPDTRVMRPLYQARQNRFEGTWLGVVPVPLPEHYVLGFDEQSFETSPNLERDLAGFSRGTGYPAYLRGVLHLTKDPDTGRVGWRDYYVYALLVKVPLGTWLLLAAAAVAALSSRRFRLSCRDELVLGLPPLIMLASMSLLTDINIGLRYVLPVLPFLFITASRLAAPQTTVATRHSLGMSLFVGLCLGWNVVTAMVVYPHYIAYFNQLAGGPANGHKHLIDSNLDWGQDLLELHRWLARHPQEGRIHLAYFGSVDPSVAGIRFTLPAADGRFLSPGDPLAAAPDALVPGVYAVSVNYLTGLPFRSYNAEGRLVAIPPNAYRYLSALEPVARAGYSIWIFRLTEGDVRRLRSEVPGISGHQSHQ